MPIILANPRGFCAGVERALEKFGAPTVKALAVKSDVVFVVGGKSSSASNRLREVAELLGTRAYLVDQAEQIDPAWLEGASRIGVTAGASTPEVLVKSVVDRLSEGGSQVIIQLAGAEENVTFALPKALQG
jgi:4-hydroxy-3-methylbut-2-enyl diphosphate reductase